MKHQTILHAFFRSKNSIFSDTNLFEGEVDLSQLFHWLEEKRSLHQKESKEEVLIENFKVERFTSEK